MTKLRFVFTSISILVLLMAMSAIVSAQATRTWVSGVGDDVNPCSRTAPCKTFAGAISKTAASGEIDCIDPGGFGAVTITKSITIDGAGTMGSILASLTNGVIINDASSGSPQTSIVTLRNLSINGAGNGLNGVRVLSAKTVHIENVELFGFTGNGVDVALSAAAAGGTKIFLDDVDIRDLRGASSIGVKLSTPSGLLTGSMDRVRVDRAPTGIQVGNLCFPTIRNSITFGGGKGVEVLTGNGRATIENTILSENVTGLSVGTGATALISQCTITECTTGISSTGTVQSSGNNRILGNSSDGVTPTIVNPK
jgi:hypothetical protein